MSYEKRGVSASKADVHEAIKNLDKGLFPNAFCKILPDFVGGDPDYCNVMHADTAGTKTALAYLYWRETGNLDIWKGIVQDAIVMNTDDMACAGITDNFILSSTIGRNKGLVPGTVVKALIEGTSEFIESMREIGLNIILSGGETADVGDIVRTADVGFTAFARCKREDIVDINIRPGDVIVGFASYGRSIYEKSYNSGIGSNGLTFARHEVLSDYYRNHFPESYDPALDKEIVYTGKNRLTDEYSGYKVGEFLLSPTRTFVPLIRRILSEERNKINGLIHNTGGGQTKVLHFIKDLHVIKDNLIEVPPVFNLIREQRNTPLQEMYQVFNMGQRLEAYTDKAGADSLIKMAAEFNIHAQIVGRVEEYNGKKVTLILNDVKLSYM